jgi:hypothetical protein
MLVIHPDPTYLAAVAANPTISLTTSYHQQQFVSTPTTPHTTSSGRSTRRRTATAAATITASMATKNQRASSGRNSSTVKSPELKIYLNRDVKSTSKRTTNNSSTNNINTPHQEYDLSTILIKTEQDNSFAQYDPNANVYQPAPYPPAASGTSTLPLTRSSSLNYHRSTPSYSTMNGSSPNNSLLASNSTISSHPSNHTYTPLDALNMNTYTTNNNNHPNNNSMLLGIDEAYRINNNGLVSAVPSSSGYMNPSSSSTQHHLMHPNNLNSSHHQQQQHHNNHSNNHLHHYNNNHHNNSNHNHHGHIGIPNNHNNGTSINSTGGLSDHERRVGQYTIEERRIKIERFRERKRQRIWRKQIKYDCRKRLADNRPR